MRKINRVGEVNTNYQGLRMTIIEYVDNKNISVKFERINNIEYISSNKKYTSFLDGQIKCKYYPEVFNKGYIGDTTIIDKDKNVKKKSYACWQGMLERCYDNNTIKNPTYSNCIVCKEWLDYSCFEKWYDENYYNISLNQRIQLDKDILIKNNKIYSPETCVFVPQSINNLLTKNNKNRGSLPIGVSFDKNRNKYIININNFSKRFEDPISAFNAYKKYKEQHIKNIADEYKDKIPSKLYDALYRYEVEITD